MTGTGLCEKAKLLHACFGFGGEARALPRLQNAAHPTRHGKRGPMNVCLQHISTAVHISAQQNQSLPGRLVAITILTCPKSSNPSSWFSSSINVRWISLRPHTNERHTAVERQAPANRLDRTDTSVNTASLTQPWANVLAITAPRRKSKQQPKQNLTHHTWQGSLRRHKHTNRRRPLTEMSGGPSTAQSTERAVYSRVTVPSGWGLRYVGTAHPVEPIIRIPSGCVLRHVGAVLHC